MAIQSFEDADTERSFRAGKFGKRVGWASISRVARRKLDMLHYAARLDDLKAPPGNRLESLSGDLKDFHSIRINNQWRIVFHWTNAGPSDVRVIDYH